MKAHDALPNEVQIATRCQPNDRYPRVHQQITAPRAPPNPTPPRAPPGGVGRGGAQLISQDLVIPRGLRRRGRTQQNGRAAA